MKISIYTTGGTIDKIYYDAKNDYQIGEPQIGLLLREALVGFEFEVHSLMMKDSLDLTDADRALVRERVSAETNPHILITHGTDTMVQTGQALQGIEGKTIVLVGSMQPARFRVTDAIFNIGFAVAAVQTLPPGVYIAMNGQVFDPMQARKNVEANTFEVTL